MFFRNFKSFKDFINIYGADFRKTPLKQRRLNALLTNMSIVEQCKIALAPQQFGCKSGALIACEVGRGKRLTCKIFTTH